MPSAKDKIAKILVLGKQEPLLAQRESYNIHIAHTCCGFRNVEDIVTTVTQVRDQWRRNTFVGDPAHLSAVDGVFVGKIIGGE